MRPDRDTTDEQLWERLVQAVGRVGTVFESRPGVVLVDLPEEDSGGRHRIEIRMTAHQLRERVTVLAGAGQVALGIADPVEAGWSLFSIHLEEHLATLRPGEGFLLWHQGELHPSVDLEWPPVRAGRGG